MAVRESSAVFSSMVEEIGFKMVIPNKNLHMYVEYDLPMRATAVSTIISSLSQPVWDLQYPKDWWHALKERWFPGWMLRIFPVEYRRHTAARYCPHIGVTDNNSHIGFLQNGT